MDVTFHRAFDVCKNPLAAMEDIISLGIKRILTSGQEENAVKGIPLLRELVKKANGRIIIMSGCGINANNITLIAKETNTNEFHFSGRSYIESDMIYRNDKISMGGTVKIEEYGRQVTDPNIIKSAMDNLIEQEKT